MLSGFNIFNNVSPLEDENMKEFFFTEVNVKSYYQDESILF